MFFDSDLRLCALLCTKASNVIGQLKQKITEDLWTTNFVGCKIAAGIYICSEQADSCDLTSPLTKDSGHWSGTGADSYQKLKRKSRDTVPLTR
jgi:hypothetical protein